MVGPTLTPLAVSLEQNGLDLHWVGNATEVLDMGTVDLASAVSNPDEMTGSVVELRGGLFCPCVASGRSGARN